MGRRREEEGGKEEEGKRRGEKEEGRKEEGRREVREINILLCRRVSSQTLTLTG